jgi:hypothetical protein
MKAALLSMYRHKTWATLRLIENCQGLADDHPDATIPDVRQRSATQVVGLEQGAL